MERTSASHGALREMKRQPGAQGRSPWRPPEAATAGRCLEETQAEMQSLRTATCSLDCALVINPRRRFVTDKILYRFAATSPLSFTRAMHLMDDDFYKLAGPVSERRELLGRRTTVNCVRHWDLTAYIFSPRVAILFLGWAALREGGIHVK